MPGIKHIICMHKRGEPGTESATNRTVFNTESECKKKCKKIRDIFNYNNISFDFCQYMDNGEELHCFIHA